MMGDVEIKVVLLSLFVYTTCLAREEICREVAEENSKRFRIGATVELVCDICDVEEVKWYKVDGAAETLLSGSQNGERTYSFPLESAMQGGLYRCQCGTPCDEMCSKCFELAVTLEILNFTIHPSVASVGSSITLICNATGYPEPQYQLVNLGDARWVPSELKHIGGAVMTTENATLTLNGDFKCMVVNEKGDYEVATANVVVYDPPTILKVRDFDVCGSTLQHGAYLECEVLNTTLATVKWIRNGTAITESSKYFLGVSNLEEDITVYILVVRKLMEDDFGEYICQVGSDYRDLEDEKSVQILAPKPGYIPTTEKPPIDTDCSMWKPIGVFSLAALAVIGFLFAFGIVGKLYAYFSKRTEKSNQSVSRNNGSSSTTNGDPLGEGNGTVGIGEGGVSYHSRTTDRNTATPSLTATSNSSIASSSPHDGSDMNFPMNGEEPDDVVVRKGLPRKELRRRTLPSDQPDSTQE